MSISAPHVFPGAVQHSTPYWGYPTVSAPRRIKPTILGVIHTTETTSVPLPSSGKSWTFSVERDGTVHQFMDPVIAAPWTNGDIQNPDLTNPLVAGMVGSKYNPNEFCFLTIENVNRIFAGERLTQAQLDADHAILEWGSKLSGLPVDRKHVVGHYQINGNTRINCPTVPTDRPRVFDGVITGASMPDTSIASEELPVWVNEIKPVNPPYWAVLGPDTNIRTAPTLDDSTISFNTEDDADVEVLIIGHVAGAEDAGSTDWLVYALNAGGLRVVHSKQPTDTKSITDCSTEVAEAAAPLNTRLAKVHVVGEQLAVMASNLTKA